MGTIHHNVVIATTWDTKRFKQALKWLKKNSQVPHTTLDSLINGYQTIFFGPDGSKEGWESSNVANNQRDKFINFLEQDSFWDWVEVGYGELGQRIIRGNNDEDRNS